jgi:ferrochelatase
VYSNPLEAAGDDRVGVLMVNLGTPEAPTAAAVRRYLRQFLSDPRVVELPRWLWLPILHGVVLPLRPVRSARAYERIWTGTGSPLLVISRRQRQGLEELLRSRHGDRVDVELAMRYGEPSIRTALARLAANGHGRILVLPMYPQYSCSTTASVFDAVFAELSGWRRLPQIRTVDDWHDDDDYVEALAQSILEHRAGGGGERMLLFSFHGTPKRYRGAGDPYHDQCHVTAQRVARRLDLAEDHWRLSFQSRFGRAPWLEPYTDETLESLARDGAAVDVICPGFSADCLETLDEIDIEDRQRFLAAGGREFGYSGALNDRPRHIEALAAIVGRHVQGWV